MSGSDWIRLGLFAALAGCAGDCRCCAGSEGDVETGDDLGSHEVEAAAASPATEGPKPPEFAGSEDGLASSDAADAGLPALEDGSGAPFSAGRTTEIRLRPQIRPDAIRFDPRQQAAPTNRLPRPAVSPAAAPAAPAGE